MGRAAALKLLLDTHALLWWATLNAKLSAKAKRAIGDKKAEVYVSAASAWEVATKVRIGKLDWPPEAGTFRDYVVSQSFRPLPISLEHAEHAGQLPLDHRDPFDRMLIAQALLEDMHLVTNETAFDAAGVRRYW